MKIPTRKEAEKRLWESRVRKLKMFSIILLIMTKAKKLRFWQGLWTEKAPILPQKYF